LRVDVFERADLTASMRWLSFVLLSGLILSGCAKDKPVVWSPVVGPSSGLGALTPPSNKPAAKPIVTPEIMLVGKVVRFSSEGRFAVLNFPIGRLPGVDQKLHVYRQGLKVGEVKVTGPQKDDNTVADLVAGETQVGDEVRDK
jgi:hypothetical protein